MSNPLPSDVTAALEVIVRRLIAASEPDSWVDAAACELPPRAIRDAVRRGDLEGHRVAKKLLVRRSKLDAYIEKRRVRPAQHAEQHDNVRELLGRGRRIG